MGGKFPHHISAGKRPQDRTWKHIGPEHPYTAQSLSNLAELYREQERYVDAKPFYQRAIAIYERVLGINQPEVRLVFDNYASSLSAMNRENETPEI